MEVETGSQMPAKEGQPPRWAFAFANPGTEQAVEQSSAQDGTPEVPAGASPPPPRWLLNLLWIVFLQGNTYGGHREPFLRVWQPKDLDRLCKAYIYKVWTKSEFEKMLRNVGLELSDAGLSAGDAPLDGPLQQRSQSGLTKAKHTPEAEEIIPRDRVKSALLATMPKQARPSAPKPPAPAGPEEVSASAATAEETTSIPTAAVPQAPPVVDETADLHRKLQAALPACKRYSYPDGVYWELGTPVARAIATIKRPNKEPKVEGMEGPIVGVIPGIIPGAPVPFGAPGAPGVPVENAAITVKAELVPGTHAKRAL